MNTSSVRRAGVISALLLGVAVVLPTPTVTARPPVVPALAPRANRVVMFTDSVGLGAKTALPAAFPADWDVRVDGEPARMVGQLEEQQIRPQLATNPEWFGEHVVIAAGYNFPYWDHGRFVREVDSLIHTLTAAGVEHVHWVTLREVDPQYVSPSAWRQIQPYYWYFPDVNRLLEQALERHPNLSLVDWRAAADRPGLTYDAIHLNPTGAALYSGLVRASVDAAAKRLPDGSTTRVHVDGGAGAAAAAVNITTTDPRAAGYLTAHRCDRPVPDVSIHNHRRGEVAAHTAIVPLDPAGDFCVTTRVATNLIVDVTGVFPTGAGFEPVAPTRWLDTRSRGTKVAAGGTVELDLDSIRASVGIEGHPAALAVVATSTEAESPGYLRVARCGSGVGTSNVNYLDGFAVPNLVVVEPGTDGRICVTSHATTHVVVDLFGVFVQPSGDAADGRGPVAADTATRVFDSRDDGSRVAAGSVTTLDLRPAGVAPGESAVVNLTALNAAGPGYVAAFPCDGELPDTSNLNVSPGQVVSNGAIVAVDGAARLCVFALSSVDLVVDLMGSIGAPFIGSTPVRALDTRPR